MNGSLEVQMFVTDCDYNDDYNKELKIILKGVMPIVFDSFDKYFMNVKSNIVKYHISLLTEVYEKIHDLNIFINSNWSIICKILSLRYVL